jgi:hypothetical protein
MAPLGRAAFADAPGRAPGLSFNDSLYGTERSTAMKLLTVALLLVLPAALACADIAQALHDSDALHDAGRWADARKLLLDSAAAASGAKEQAEIYWRASRETMELGNDANDAKKPVNDVLAIFIEAEGYADKAIAADPRQDWGYYYKASNIGRWGQVKGILNALFKAGPMKDVLVQGLAVNPERSEAYNVLSQLFREVPGKPLSFGNIDAAVSLERTAIDLRAAQVKAGTEKRLSWGFYNELAKTLWKRNWPAAQRATEQKAKAARFEKAATPLDKGSLYEARVTLQNGSDRDEARAIVAWVVAEAPKAGSPTKEEQDDLQTARDLVKEWQGK